VCSPPPRRAPDEVAAQVAVNATQRSILVGLLRNALELGCNLGNLTAYELAFVRSAVELMGRHREDAYRSLAQPNDSVEIIWPGEDARKCPLGAREIGMVHFWTHRPGRQGAPPRCVRAECLLSVC